MNAIEARGNTGRRLLSQFRYISFDVVGTLVDFETSVLEGLEAPAREAGVSLNTEEVFAVYRAARGRPNAPPCPDDLAYCYSVMARAFGLPDTPDYQAAMVEAVAAARPFPDSVRALASLKKHYKLIAMTNAHRWGFERYEQKLGNPFWASFTTDETGVEKPDPKFFHHVFEHVVSHGGRTEEILHAAQSQFHDIAVSRQLGLTNCWIERRHAEKGYGGTLEPAQIIRPDYHFHSMAALSHAADSAF
jgi:putative hydrolase of the HAD superfamily